MNSGGNIMEIPILTKFIEGLKLFWASKRLRWLTLIFILGALITSLLGRIGGEIILQNPGNIPLANLIQFIAAIGGGIWPIFFLITAFLSLIGLQRFIASEESYLKSFMSFIPWMVVSFVVLLMMVTFALPLLLGLVFLIAFLGWIGFQAYFSTRTSLQYAQIAEATEVSRWKQILAFISYFFCYVAVVGMFLYVSIVQGLVFSNFALWAFILLGTLLAAGFNFLNGIIMTSQRDKPTLVNIALIGLFISLYSSYFIYSAAQESGAFFVDIMISIFFLLYTMSSVGRTLASRADSDSRFKISRELAATFTYFLASGYYFADAFFTIQAPAVGQNIDNLVKLLIFPFIALIMELFYLWRGRKEETLTEEPVTEDIVPIPEEHVEEKLETPTAEYIGEEYEEESFEDNIDEDSDIESESESSSYSE
jgi:hypothetical protein